MNNIKTIHLSSLPLDEYKLYFDCFNYVHIFINKQHYILNKYESKLIYYKIKSKNLIFQKEKYNNITYNVYDIKLISKIILGAKINEIFNYIYLQLSDNIEIEISKERCLEERKTYEINKFDSNKKVIFINGVEYKALSKLMEVINRYFICKNDNIYCNYNGEEKKVKLKLHTDNYNIFKNNRYLKQNLKVEFDNKYFLFYINYHENIPDLLSDSYTENMCFPVIYYYHGRCIGHEYMWEFYCDITDYVDKIINYIPEKTLNILNETNTPQYINLENNNLRYTFDIIPKENSDGEICLEYSFSEAESINEEDETISHVSELLDIYLLKPIKEWNNTNKIN